MVSISFMDYIFFPQNERSYSTYRSFYSKIIYTNKEGLASQLLSKKIKAKIKISQLFMKTKKINDSSSRKKLFTDAIFDEY